MFSFNSFSEAYLGSLDTIFRAGRNETSRIGNQRFIRNFSYEVVNFAEPQSSNFLDRKLGSVDFPGRSPNWDYAEQFAQFVLSGSKTMPKSLIDLNPRAADFDSSQISLEAYGLPGNFSMFYGHRISGQLLEVGLELKANPDTRRAYISVLDGFNDNQLLQPLRGGLSRVEYPCTIGFNLYIEDGRLNITVDMRSQNMVSVWPYDFYLATEILMSLSDYTGLPPGNVSGHVHNAHIYERDYDHVASLLATNGF